MKERVSSRMVALLLALCLLCGSACLAEAVKADKGTIRQVQEALNAAGFDCGTADGISGKKTRAAIQQYQEANGLTANGEITEELLADMGIPLPEAEGAEVELKEVKGNAQVRNARIPIGGPAYVSNFDSEALMRVNYLHQNTRVRTVGVVDDLAGRYPVSQQKEEQVVLIRGSEGNLTLADYSKSLTDVPDFQLGNQLTASGRIGDTRVGVIRHVDGAPDSFAWELANVEPNDVSGLVELEPTGDAALCIQADAIDLGDVPAPTVHFSSIAFAGEYELAATLDGMHFGVEADGDSGWLVMGDDSTEGDGSGAPLVNYYTGEVIPCDEHAEAYLCDDGILQFEWRDPQTGEVVDPNDTVLRWANHFEETGVAYDAAANGEPRSYQLYAKFYNFDGTLQEERQISDYREDETLQDYSRVQEAVDGLRAEYKAHEKRIGEDGAEAGANRRVLEFVKDGDDAVAYDADGNGLIRYPFTEPEDLYGVLLEDEGIITVMYRNRNGNSTEIFLPRWEHEEEYDPDARILIERNLPESAQEVQDAHGGKFPGVRIVGTATEIDAEYPCDIDWQLSTGSICLETGSGLCRVDFGPAGLEAPSCQAGSTITAYGTQSYGLIAQIEDENYAVIRSYSGIHIFPTFIASGDVPVPEEYLGE